MNSIKYFCLYVDITKNFTGQTCTIVMNVTLNFSKRNLKHNYLSCFYINVIILAKYRKLLYIMLA
jgi:hypothetical protein